MSSSTDVTTIRSARPSQQLVRPDPESPRRLIYAPRIQPAGPSRYEVRGEYEDKTIVAWGFWGGLVVAAAALFLILNSDSIYSLWDMLWALGAMGLGYLLYRYGKRSSLREIVLCEIDLLRGLFSWPAREGQRCTVSFEEVTELVFGMTEYPVSERKSDVYVHAFTVLVREGEERLVPVVEATPDKERAHGVAEALSRELRMPISYVGKGIR